MIPITLEWQRCPEGVETRVYKSETGGVGLGYLPRTDRAQPVSYDVQNLEQPYVIRFLNCRDRSDFEKFFTRFGMLDNDVDQSDERVASIHDLLSTALGWKREVGADDNLILVNQLLETTAPMHLGFDRLGDGSTPRMVVRPKSLYGLMCAEIAVATQAGADLKACEDCSELFFTGHLTGRRSTAQYCSDKCRMRAQRKRAKGE